MASLCFGDFCSSLWEAKPCWDQGVGEDEVSSESLTRGEQ